MTTTRTAAEALEHLQRQRPDSFHSDLSDLRDYQRLCADWIEEFAWDVEKALRAALEQPQSLEEVLLVVHQQADDEGLWFAAKTAPEAYLQHQLRLLHEVIESAVLDKYGNPLDGSEFRNCSFPDCGCDGARNCDAKSGPSWAALQLNIK